MRKVLIGSRAAQYCFPDFRQSKDEDYLVDYEVSSTKKIEYHNANLGIGLTNILDEDQIASPETLYTLKLSHCFWSINWAKTMHDINFFQNKNVIHNEKLFKELYKDWEVIHGKKKASLKKSNEDFFKDNVNRKYVHDDIHKAIAYYDEPMFNKVKQDISQALLSKEMFNALSHEDKLKLCREEIYATAIERFIVPRDFRIDKLVAYRGACRLLMTSMTKGWFPTFIALNWKQLSNPDDHDFIGLFKEIK